MPLGCLSCYSLLAAIDMDTVDHSTKIVLITFDCDVITSNLNRLSLFWNILWWSQQDGKKSAWLPIIGNSITSYPHASICLLCWWSMQGCKQFWIMLLLSNCTMLKQRVSKCNTSSWAQLEPFLKKWPSPVYGCWTCSDFDEINVYGQTLSLYVCVQALSSIYTSAH